VTERHVTWYAHYVRGRRHKAVLFHYPTIFTCHPVIRKCSNTLKKTLHELFYLHMTFNIRFYFTVCTQPTCTLPSSARVLRILRQRMTYIRVETCHSCRQTQTVLPKYNCVLTDTNFVNSPQSVCNNNMADARDYYVRVTKALNNCTVMHLGKTRQLPFW
jgi:hypothetical protein